MRQRPLTRRRSARPRRAGALVLALVVLGAPGPGAAQSTLGGGRGTLLVPDADTVPPTQFTTSFGAGYAPAPGGGFRPAPVGVTLGFWNDLDLGLSLRSWAKGDPAGGGATVDPQLALKLRLVREAPGRPALALALALDHPFQGLDLSPSLIVHEDRGPALLTAQLGWRLPVRGGAAGGAAPFAALGAGYWLSSSLSFFAQVLAEGGPRRRLWLAPGVAWSLLGPDPSAQRREALRAKAKASVAALEAELGTRVETTPEKPELAALPLSAPALDGRTARLAAPGRVTFFATGGPALGAGPGWQVLAGVQISSFDEFLQDSDGDGLPDRVDRCPYEPEDWDGYEDGDGCPDHGTEILRKLTLARLAAEAAQAPQLTTPFPRFRLRIPLGVVPAPGTARDVAPMYRPLDAPPLPKTPEGGDTLAPAPRPPGASDASGPGARPSAARPGAAPAPPAVTTRATQPHGAPVRPAPVTVAVLLLSPARLERGPTPGIAAPTPRRARATGPAVGVERVVTAAAFVRFASPEQPLSDEDLAAIEGAVRRAESGGGELLVWARARTPDLLFEAAWRADAIAAIAAREGAVAGTRVTTSPNAWSDVEVEVSARSYRVLLPDAPTTLRDDAGHGTAPPLEDGEAAREQLRAAMLAHRGEIQACLAAGARGAPAATEAVIRVAVGQDGSAVAALHRDSPLWRPAVDACLAARARGWRLPPADGGYVVDVPVQVTRGGGR